VFLEHKRIHCQFPPSISALNTFAMYVDQPTLGVCCVARRYFLKGGLGSVANSSQSQMSSHQNLTTSRLAITRTPIKLH